MADGANSKPLVWLHGEVKTPPFSARARLQAGFLLRQLQDGVGLSMPHSRPMSTIGSGVHELRITGGARGEWHIVYSIEPDAFVVLDAFQNHKPDAGIGEDGLPQTPRGASCVLTKERKMTPEKRARLEAAGFRVSDAAEFLNLTPEENEMVELRVSLARLVNDLRRKKHLTQKELATRIGSDQARISRLESADLSVSVDQMLEAAFALGASRKDISDILAA